MSQRTRSLYNERLMRDFFKCFREVNQLNVFHRLPLSAQRALKGCHVISSSVSLVFWVTEFNSFNLEMYDIL